MADFRALCCSAKAIASVQSTEIKNEMSAEELQQKGDACFSEKNYEFLFLIINY